MHRGSGLRIELPTVPRVVTREIRAQLGDFRLPEARKVLVLSKYWELGVHTPAGDGYSTLDAYPYPKIRIISKTYPKHIFSSISAYITVMRKVHFQSQNWSICRLLESIKVCSGAPQHPN